MGYALAEAAVEAGASVTLISGPVSLSVPPQVKCVPVISAQNMYDEVMRKIPDYDILLAVAAVGDYRAETIAQHKIHKEAETLQLTLERNPDIVLAVGQLPRKPFIVGFAAETENLLETAKAKRKRKHIDILIANEVGEGKGIGSDDNAVIVLGEELEITLPSTPKPKLARQLITMIANEFKKMTNKEERP